VEGYTNLVEIDLDRPDGRDRKGRRDGMGVIIPF